VQSKDSAKKSTSHTSKKTSGNRNSRDFVRLENQRSHHDPASFFNYEVDSGTSSSAVNSSVINDSLTQLSRGIAERQQIERQLSLSREINASKDEERRAAMASRTLSHTSV
jgi:hypothetical protein